MPSAVSVENNFSAGLFTEATGFNFPENALTDVWNCVINKDTSISRRLGFDFEGNFDTKAINRAGVAIKDYLWRNVSGNGDITVYVTQVGSTLYFYRTGFASLSAGAIADTITLNPVGGAPSPSTVEVQFCDGNGYLFVTHPYCDPIRIAYDTNADTVSDTIITIKIRDFEGDPSDPYTVSQRPTSTLAGLDVHHAYNLYNQGWNSTTLGAWDTARTDMPSNADVSYVFKNTSDNFDASVVDSRTNFIGNTEAPKGHFILNLASQNRDSASGLTGTTATTTGSQRPSTAAFFTGRLFYAGINYPKFNSNIYFTQIIERDEQYGYAYQTNDPSSEERFDLLPSDGGVIRINDAGTIHKLVAVPGGLVVFAANGIWFITGSQGIGFTANDYSIQKISSIGTLSATSFVDIGGYPSWWNSEGIYTIVAEGNLPAVKNLTLERVHSFYREIPEISKKYARGSFHKNTGIVTWVYRSTSTEDINDLYSFDRVLCLNTNTGAFFPYSVDISNVSLHGVIVMDSSTGQLSVDNVVNGADNVVDADGNQVVVFSTLGPGTQTPVFKFLVSYPAAGSYTFTFAEERNEQYLDWFQYDTTGTSYTSYFITGYKLRGESIRKFQSNWVKILSRLDLPVSYYFQGIWDYARTGDQTGRWSVAQLIEHEQEDLYSVKSRRLKVRGHGITLQFKVESVPGKFFDILGWSCLNYANQLP